MDCNNLFAYPGFNDEFKVHTDANKFQLWAVIIQKGKTIAISILENLPITRKVYSNKKGDIKHCKNSKGV